MSSGAKIQLTIDAETRNAESSLKNLQAEATRTGESVSKLDQAAAAQHLERFEGKLHRNAEAARYFGGETAALEKEQQMLRREIERLIRQGMDPLDSTVRNLRTRYDENAASLTRLTSSKQTYTAATRTATRTAATFLRTILPIASAAAAIGTATRFIRESGQAFEEAEAQAQKFAITYDGITDEAERSARELAATFGYAQSSMRGILAETGDILTGFGLAGEAALDLTEKAAYLGAALAKMNPNIGDASSATQDLTKMMAGQAMSMQKWGVVVRDSAVQARLAQQGLSGLTGEALLQAQAQARLEIAYEQSRNALANVTSETILAADVNRRYNEAWKERREIVGEAVQNFFLPIKSQITEHIEAWNEATRAKRNYDEAVAGSSGADYDTALETAERKVANLAAEVARLEENLSVQEQAFASRPYNPRVDSALNLIRGQLTARKIELSAAEIELEQIQSRIAQREIDAQKRGPASESGGRTAQMVEAYRASAAELEKVTGEINAQFASIEKLASAHEQAGISFDEFAQKQAAVRKTLVDLASDDTLHDDHLSHYIERYKEFLADLEAPPETISLDEITGSLDEITGRLEEQIQDIELLGAAYHQAGKDFDEFGQKQRSVISTFEELAEAGADQEYLQDYIDQYAEFFAVVDEGDPSLRTLQEILSSVDEAAFNASQAAWMLGDESEIAASKIAVMEDELQRMTESGQYTEWQIYQMEQAIRSFKEELEDHQAIRAFEQALGKAFGGMLNDFFSSLAQGNFDAIRTTERGVSSIVSAVSSAAMTAFPQFAPLIAMAEGAVQGLNKAIFGTITASRDAQKVISDQRQEIGKLFAEVLGLEEQLHCQRLDAIREQMDLLSEQHDLEMEILRDRWQRGEITGEQYFQQAMAASRDHREEQASYERQAREEQASYDRQASLIEGVRGTIEELEKELDGLSGWTKFWTSADTKLKKEISRYEQMLSSLLGYDGLTEAQVAELARSYGISIPGAARGAEFVTSGPMLMAVGDNPGGREHVQVTPLSSYNAYGPRQDQRKEIHIHLHGNTYGIEDLYGKLDEAGRKLKALGRLPA